MSSLEDRLATDKALRDTALTLVKADLALVQADLKARSVRARLTDRASEGAIDLIDDAIGYAQANRTAVAAGLSAIGLWFARRPLLAIVSGIFVGSRPDADSSEDEENCGEEPGDYAARCHDNNRTRTGDHHDG